MKRSVFALAISFLLVFPSLAFATDAVIDNAGTTTADWGYTSRQYRGQSFQLPTNARISAVKINLRKEASPTDNVVIKIYNDSSGVPGTVLATSSSIAGTTLTTSSVEYTFTFSPALEVTASTTYYISAQRTGSLNDTNYYYNYHNTGNPYASGQAYQNTGSWSAQSANDIRSTIVYSEIILGCTYEDATNYDPDATDDDGSCEFETGGAGGMSDDQWNLENHKAAFQVFGLTFIALLFSINFFYQKARYK